MYIGMANREKRPKQERDDIRFTHIAIPTSFTPHHLAAPHADYLSIHHPRNPQNSITISITQFLQLHHTNTIIQNSYSVTWLQ